MFTRHETYHDTGFDYAAVNVKKNATRWIKELKTYGYVVKRSAAVARSTSLFHLLAYIQVGRVSLGIGLLAFTVTYAAYAIVKGSEISNSEVAMFDPMRVVRLDLFRLMFRPELIYRPFQFVKFACFRIAISQV